MTECGRVGYHAQFTKGARPNYGRFDATGRVRATKSKAARQRERAKRKQMVVEGKREPQTTKRRRRRAARIAAADNVGSAASGSAEVLAIGLGDEPPAAAAAAPKPPAAPPVPPWRPRRGGRGGGSSSQTYPSRPERVLPSSTPAANEDSQKSPPLDQEDAEIEGDMPEASGTEQTAEWRSNMCMRCQERGILRAGKARSQTVGSLCDGCY